MRQAAQYAWMGLPWRRRGMRACRRYYSFEGADGKNYTLLQVEGQLNDRNGIFEYILDSNGYVTHQRFIINGVYTGTPNQ